MAISAKCPSCGKSIAAPASAAGHKAKCPKCGGVVKIPDDPTAALAAAIGAKAAGGSLTPTPSRTAGTSGRSATTTVSRMLARTSPYQSLRVLAAVIFGVGIAVTVVVFLGGLAGLILISTHGNPWLGVAAFVGALIASVILLLGARTASELVRLWADVGDRARQVSLMLEESLNRDGGEGD